jgi:hypothetical protein
MWGFSKNPMLFENISRKMKAFPEMWGILNGLRLFKDIFREFESLDYMCEAFIKTTRFFEDVYREMEASIRNLDFFKDYEVFEEIFNKI